MMREGLVRHKVVQGLQLEAAQGREGLVTASLSMHLYNPCLMVLEVESVGALVAERSQD